MSEYFSEMEQERIKDISDVLKKRYGITEDNFEQCIEFLFQKIEENTDDEILDKTWNILCPENAKPEHILSLFDHYCSIRECGNCPYCRYSDKTSCRIAFTLDYMKDNKELFEGD